MTIILYIVAVLSFSGQASSYKVWSIGAVDNSSEFALARKDFRNFLANDFGYEDKIYLINYSNLKKDFPYVLPGQPLHGVVHGLHRAGTHQANILLVWKMLL